MHHSRTGKNRGFLWGALWIVFFVLICWPRPSQAEETGDTFTLKSSIEYAFDHNIQMLSAAEEVGAADANKKGQFTNFLPKATANYAYTRLDEQQATGGFVIQPKDLHQFTANVSQPVFAGFSILTQYQISALNLDMAKLLEKQTRQDLIFDVKTAYFELLQSQNLETVAGQQVTQLKAHVDVATNFYEVGMIPRNDVLQSEVELANAEQELVVKQNEVVLAKARFNTLLRRPIDAPLFIEDVPGYEPFSGAYEECVQTALKQRIEIRLADSEVMAAQKEVKLVRGNYFPAVDLQTNYYRRGDDPSLDGGPGIYDKDGWDVIAMASWTFWEWGKTRYGVEEKLKRLSQAQLNRERVGDNVRQDVKRAYITLKAAEKNIMTAEKAVEQAKENLRINNERYKEQVATTTDVLDAQTLLTDTQTKYYNTLSVFNIAKGGLNRAMGIEIITEP
jgi:outer membrane protein